MTKRWVIFAQPQSFFNRPPGFFCLEAMLNIELDGRQHGTPEQHAKDSARMSGWRRGESKCVSGTVVCGARKK
jgi:hypothetical protein